jgi:hypothetical protein
MVFDRKSIVTGMSSHPTVRCILPFVGVPRLLPVRQSVNRPIITFRASAKIECTAGGFYGDEFRPN